MKRLPRDPMRFEIINAFDAFGRQEKVTLHEAAAADGFVAEIRASVTRSLENDAFLQGLRTQAMFESLVASLGAVKVLKQEDSGEIYVSDDAENALEIPDYRLVLEDGSQMLIEVKNFYQRRDPTEAYSLDATYLEGLLRYAKLTACKLLIAVHWARWNFWSLVPPEVFSSDGKRSELRLPVAMQANHMAILGDMSIGARFPLCLLMHTDKTKPRHIEPDGTATFTVSRVELQCADRVITDPREKQIATYLMFYGRWHYETELRTTGNEIDAFEHRWVPVEDTGQGFEIVGSLGEMFSAYYKFFTQEEDKVSRLGLDINPGSWGQLIPTDYKSETLPLWRFTLEPSLPGVKTP